MGSLKRFAVLVGNGQFKEFPTEDLPPLKTPANDLVLLKEALSNPNRGNFEVACFADCTSHDVRDAIESVILKAKDPDALGLIYYSGHGLLDQSNGLHLVTADSKPGGWTRTIAVADISSLIRNHRPQRLVILLDCCYSGAGINEWEFKGATTGVSSGVVESFRQLEGKGVVMMTATTPIQRAAGSIKTGHGVFTRHVAAGIGKAKARADKHGEKEVVTVNSLYEYVREKMREEGCEQDPMIWGRQVGGEIILAESDLLGTNSTPTDPKIAKVTQLRASSGVSANGPNYLHVIGPTYILDKNYNFINWNTAFENIVAHPLSLVRGSHVGSFLKQLRNYDSVFKRSNERFVPGSIPTVDIEVLEYDSPEYGLIIFNKIAAQVLGANGRLRAWCVSLNVSSVQRPREFWRAMEDALRRDLNWSRYALSYDKIISEFTDYQKLLNMVVGKVGTAKSCADLGAGTGNVTMKLLNADPARRVLAIEKNEGMVDILQRKLDEAVGLRGRAVLYKGDITTCLMEEKEKSLDACLMLNVLFALEHPKEALAAVSRVLRSGGILSLSTSHKDTDVRKLFGKMQADLQNRGHWDERTAATWEDAFTRNLDMRDMITRHSKDEIRQLVEASGLKVEEYHPSEYVDCVVVVKAIKL
jgi:ubiquinone/menaquinone biosynthesis C-methylase UbiE